MHRLVKAELLLQRLDEFRVQPLRPLVFDAAVAAQLRLFIAARLVAGIAADPRRGIDVGPLHFCDDLLDRPAGNKLNDGKGHQHDAEQGRDHQQYAFEDIGAHGEIQFPLAVSYHQVSTMPRSYLGFIAGQP